MRRSLVFALGLGALTGCLMPPARQCEGDGECMLEGRVGRCEPIGYCAYPNDACELGFSYGPYAPEGIANACLEVFGRWALDAPIAMIDATLIDDDIVVGGLLDDVSAVVALPSEMTRSFPDLSLVALADSDGQIMVAGSESGIPTLVALGPSLEPVWQRRWSTGTGDEITGLGTASDGGALVGGRAYDRAWVEQVAADGASVWSRQWEADDPPVQLVLARGGLAHVIGSQPGGVFARTFTARGDMKGPIELSSVAPSVILGGATSTTGVTWFGPERVWASGHDLSSPLEVALVPGSATAAVLDGANNLVVVQALEALMVDTYDPSGTLMRSVQLSLGPVDHVEALVDASSSVVVVAGVAANEVLAWRLRP